MKNYKRNFMFILILLFVNSIFALSEKRDLSTPLSRLVGHWITPEKNHWYFGPTSSPDLTGSFIRMFPNKETLKKLFDDSVKNPSKAELEEAKRFIETFAGMASYCKYKVVTQEPGGNKLKIRIYWNDEDPEQEALGQLTIYVDKEGLQIKLVKKVPFTSEELIDEENPMKYIDSKMSPDGKKMNSCELNL
jgi:hypothetical protein